MLSWRSSLDSCLVWPLYWAASGSVGREGGGARAAGGGGGRVALRVPYLGNVVVVPENGFEIWVAGWRGIEYLQSHVEE
jgi:hypothetical protein